MALTTNQLNAHLRTIMALVADNIGAGDSKVFLALLLGCNQHATGGADNSEAAQFWGRLLFEQVIGRPPTQNDLHYLQNHLAADANAMAGGEL